jgi:integrase
MKSAQDLPRAGKKDHRSNRQTPPAHSLPGQMRGRSFRLTLEFVRTVTLPPGKTDYTFFDDKLKGFGLRLRDTGARTFVFQYNIGKITRRMVLGATTAISVSQAREAAQRYYLRVKAGADPFTDKVVAKQQAADTFKAAMAEYLATARKRLRPRTYPDIERHLLKFAKPLHELPLAKIERSHNKSVIASVSKSRGEVTGNRCRASLSAFYTWAMEEKDLDANPVIGIRRNKEKSRSRVLLPTELRAIWNALGDDDYGDIIKLLALSGCRAAEIAGLRWSEIQGDVIILPANRTKNNRAHVIPLAPAARAIIARRQKRDDREFVFGRGQQAFSGWSKCKQRLDAKIKEKTGKALPHWMPHDLRRSFATYAGGGLPEHLFETLNPRDKKLACGLGIGPHIIEAVLNHVSGHKQGVAGIYNQSTYAAEKKTTLDRWAEHLAAIVEGRDSNVLPLQRA